MKISVKEFNRRNGYYPAERLIKGQIILCTTCEKKEAHCYELGGVYAIGDCTTCKTRKDREFGSIDLGLPEFTTDAIKDGRREYFNSMVQPSRDGIPSREFYEANPEKAKKIFKEEGLKKMQYVWRDASGWSSRHKSK